MAKKSHKDDVDDDVEIYNIVSELSFKGYYTND